MEQAKIERINELARLAKTRPLTDDERKERAQLRREYIAAVTGSLQEQLDRIYIADESGTPQKLKKKGD